MLEAVTTDLVSPSGPDALEMRCPLLSRKQTSIGRRRKVGFLDLIPKSLRMNQPTSGLLGLISELLAYEPLGPH